MDIITEFYMTDVKLTRINLDFLHTDVKKIKHVSDSLFVSMYINIGGVSR